MEEGLRKKNEPQRLRLRLTSWVGRNDVRPGLANRLPSAILHSVHDPLDLLGRRGSSCPPDRGQEVLALLTGLDMLREFGILHLPENAVEIVDGRRRREVRALLPSVHSSFLLTVDSPKRQPARGDLFVVPFASGWTRKGAKIVVEH